MNDAEIFAEWLRRQGQRVLQTESSYWHEQGPRVFQAFPYHWLIQPSKTEILQFLKTANAIALRYSSPPEIPSGKLSYHTVYEASEYNLEQLGKRSRKNTRRGLQHCQVEPISLERLAEEAWFLNLDTLERQGQAFDAESQKKHWQLSCRSAQDLPNFQAWGALVEGKLAASLLSFRMGDCIYILSQQSSREFLALNVNNALTYTVTQHYTQNPEIKLIFYGLHSLDAPATVDDFKFHMGYHAKKVRQSVAFHPFLRPLANPLSYSAVKGLAALRPKTRSIAKVEGILRFYLEGQRPLAEQNIPAVLTEDGDKSLED